MPQPVANAVLFSASHLLARPAMQIGTVTFVPPTPEKLSGDTPRVTVPDAGVRTLSSTRIDSA